MFRKLCFLMVLGLLLGCIGCRTSGEPVRETTGFTPDPIAQIEEDGTKAVEVVVYYVVNDDEPYLVREVHLASSSGNPVMTAVNELLHGVPTTSRTQAVFPKSLSCLDCRWAEGTAEITLTKDLVLSDADHDVLALAVTGLVNTLTEHDDIEKVNLKVDDVPRVDVDIWLTRLGFKGQPLTRDITKVLEPSIWVEQPAPNQAVACPVSVKGSAIVSGGVVELRLTTEAGEVLAESIVETPGEETERRSFETDIVYTYPASGRGFLEVFQTDPVYGHEKDKVIVPVELRASGVNAGGP